MISPWLSQGFNSTVFDHTSLLRFLIDKWELDQNSLGARTAEARTFATELQELSSPRTNAPAPFDLDALTQPQVVPPDALNEHQSALATFAHFLEQEMSHVEELAAVGYRALKALDGPLSQLSVAKDRFLLFLHHGQAGRLE